MVAYETYIKPELLIVVAVLYAIGAMVKRMETIPDKYIPVILGVIGIVICSVYVVSVEGFSGVGMFTAITQGVLCASTAVFTNQLFKQSSK